MSSRAPLSLLARFPASPAGHLAFVEWVRDEVHHAADAKRQQLARSYSDRTLANMVRGIKWAEAGRRVLGLSDFPTDATDQVSHVLRRELTVGTIEQIDELLTPAVRSLRDAWEDLRFPKSANEADGSRTSRRKRRGRKEADAKTVRLEAQLVVEWKRARESGVYKADFAKGKKMTLKAFDQLLDRVSKRNKRSDN